MKKLKKLEKNQKELIDIIDNDIDNHISIDDKLKLTELLNKEIESTKKLKKFYNNE